MAKSPTFDELYARYPTQEAGEALFALESEGQTPDEAENTLLRRVYRKSRKTGDKARYAKMLGQDEATFDTTLSKWQKSAADRQVTEEGGTPGEAKVGPGDTGYNPLDAGAARQMAKAKDLPSWTFLPQLHAGAERIAGASSQATAKVGEAGGLIGEGLSLANSKRQLELGINPETNQPFDLTQVNQEGRQQIQNSVQTQADRANRIGRIPSSALPLPVGPTPGEQFAADPRFGSNRETEIFGDGEAALLGLATILGNIIAPSPVAGMAASAGKFGKSAGAIDPRALGEVVPDAPQRAFQTEQLDVLPTERGYGELQNYIAPEPVAPSKIAGPRKPLKRMTTRPEPILPRNFQPEVEQGPRLPFSQEMGPVPPRLPRDPNAGAFDGLSVEPDVNVLPYGADPIIPQGRYVQAGRDNPADLLAPGPQVIQRLRQMRSPQSRPIGKANTDVVPVRPDLGATAPGIEPQIPQIVRNYTQSAEGVVPAQGFTRREGTQAIPGGTPSNPFTSPDARVMNEMRPMQSAPGFPVDKPVLKGAKSGAGSMYNYRNWLKKNKLVDSPENQVAFARKLTPGGGTGKVVLSEVERAAREVVDITLESKKGGYATLNDVHDTLSKMGYTEKEINDAVVSLRNKEILTLDSANDPSALAAGSKTIDSPTGKIHYISKGRGYTSGANSGRIIVREAQKNGPAIHRDSKAEVSSQSALARVPGNQVVDSTRMIETEVDRLGLRSWNNRDNNAFGVNRPVDADGRIVGVLVGQRGPAFAPGLRNFNKWKVNPAAFPDRLPMGDRQGDSLVDRGADFRNKAKIRETAAQGFVTRASEDVRQVERNELGGARQADARPGRVAHFAEIRRRASATQDELPALSDLVKRESDALDDYLKKSGRYESLSGGLSLKAAHDTLESGLKKAKKFLGATPENKNVSMALDKFIGRKAFIFSSAQDVVNTAKRQGLSTKAAVEFAEQRIDKELREARKEFVTTAEKNGLNAEEANVLSRELVEFSGATPRLLKAFTRYVKTSKVLLNPMSSYVNNGVGNIGFQLMGGGQKQMLTAGSELKSSGAHYKRALKDGLFGSEFFAHNKMDFIKNLHAENAEGLVAHGMKYARKPVQGLAALYDGTDKVFKLASYIQKFEDLKKAGLSESVASREAVHHVGLFFPNYEKIGGFAGILRKSSFAPYVFNPFIAFPSESVRIYKNWVLHGGARGKTLAAALPAYLWASYQRGLLLNQDPEETKTAREDLPGYQNFGGRFNVPLYKRADGETTFLDITQWVPLLDLLSGGTMDKNKSKGENIFNLSLNALTRFAGGGLLTSEQYKASGQPGVYDSVRNFANAPSRGTAQDVTRTRAGGLLTPPIVSRALSFGQPRKGEEEGDKIRDAMAAFGIRTLTTSDATREQRDRQEDGQQTEASREAGYIQNNQNIPEEDQDELVEDILSRYE